MTGRATSPMQSLRLAGDRRLAWYEYGDPEGVPCIYTTGTPASGLAGAAYHEAARNAGVRFVSVDKPGYGHSDFMPGRRLDDWPRDIAALADHLGIARFAAMGESGGGPHVLAIAWGLPERVTVALSVAGMGPGHEAWVREGMKPMNRRLFWMAQRTPWLLRLAMGQMGRNLKDPKRRAKFVDQQLAAQPAADRKVLGAHPALFELMMTSLEDAFREGPRGAAQEMAIFAQPWGFALSDIRVPVQVWHGTEDANVPVAIARRVCAEIPGAEAHILEGEGHAFALGCPELLMREIVKAA